MSDPPKPTMRAAAAGSMLIATILLCAAIGLGVGALLGVPVPFLLAGLFVGPVLGVLVVRSRFRDL
jgi:hypothetical protein